MAELEKTIEDKLIEQLTPDELLSFMKVFQTHAHNSETLMQPE